jgi:nucleoside-diphosphate-sugar epimerase
VAAQAQSALFKAVGRSSPIEPASVDMATYFWYFDSTKAQSELGFAPREASETIFDTIRYIRENSLGKGVFVK